ncbi:Capsule polysaccharide export protein [Hyphomicrobiales bacterium]|nr:Capsule polysaccharide export protein [Hyphomicrobiales bacterium]CAH1666160.1 Capsule polysaccharide export protein [Hyphomicrobiales bacterium]
MQCSINSSKIMARTHSLVYALFIGLACAACAQRQPAVEVFRALPSQPYTLGPGDRLRVIVFSQDNLSNIYTVDAQGRITMPLVGTIPATGRTTQDLAKLIEQKLRASYLREPRVTVEVDTYRPFFILGEVQSSGQYPFVSGMTVQTAVAIAGGFSPRADQNEVQITRQQGGKVVIGTVPLTYPVQPGDTIMLKERWF